MAAEPGGTPLTRLTLWGKTMNGQLSLLVDGREYCRLLDVPNRYPLFDTKDFRKRWPDQLVGLAQRFAPDFIEDEVNKAYGWHVARSPKRRRRDISAMLGRWFRSSYCRKAEAEWRITSARYGGQSVEAYAKQKETTDAQSNEAVAKVTDMIGPLEDLV